MTRKLDSFDRRILAQLQTRGDLGPVELAEIIHLSPSQCSRRLQRLKSEGYVGGIVALLNEDHLNIGVVAYVLTTLKSHAPEQTELFQKRIGALCEVVECHKMTGEADYILKVCTRNLESFNNLLTHHLLVAPEIATVRSSIVLDRIKSTTQLPLEFL
jgi:Lrp/AsnC family leucine-responsive transcriptional regulator